MLAIRPINRPFSANSRGRWLGCRERISTSSCPRVTRIENDRKAIEELHRVLKPGGTAVVSVDSIEGVFEIVNTKYLFNTRISAILVKEWSDLIFTHHMTIITCVLVKKGKECLLIVRAVNA